MATRLCRWLKEGDILSLTGELGAGKTCFVKGLATGLGIEKTITSPTFNLIREYKGKLPLYHFDVYRIKKVDELFDLGYEEYFFGDGVTVVEWGDKIAGLFPESHLRIEFTRMDDPDKRRLKVYPGSEKWIETVEKWGKDVDFSI